MSTKLDISRPVRCAMVGCVWRAPGADGEPRGEPGKFARLHPRQRFCPEHEPNEIKARRAAKQAKVRCEQARATTETSALIPVRLKARRSRDQATVDKLLAEARKALQLLDVEFAVSFAAPESVISVREYVRGLCDLATATADGRPWNRVTQVQRLGMVWAGAAVILPSSDQRIFRSTGSSRYGGKGRDAEAPETPPVATMSTTSGAAAA